MAIIQYGGIRIDVQANTQGVKALRTDMASLSREFAKTMTPVEKLEAKLAKVAAQIQKHGEATVFTDRVTISAVNTYLEAEKAAGRYAEAIDFVAKRLPELAASMKQLEETRRRDDAMAAAAASAKRQAEVDKLVLQERIERERQAAALSKKIDKDMANEKVATQKAANDQQKQLMQQLSDVEEFFEQRSLARKKSYIDHKVRMEKEAAELLKLIAKKAEEFEKQQREQAQAQLDLDAKLDAERIHRKRNDRQKAAEITAEDEKKRNDEAAKTAKQTADLNEKLLQEEMQRRRSARQTSAKLDERDAQATANARKKEKQAADAAARDREREREKEAAMQARAQRMVNAILRESMSPVDQLRMRLEKLRAEFEKGRISQEQFAAASKATEQQIRNLQSATGESSRMAQFATSFAGGLSPMGAFTAGAIGFTAGQEALQFAKDSVTAYMDLRQSLIKLEVVLGSSSRALMAFSELREIAVATNQTSDAVMRGAVTMAQFGVSANELGPTMRRISEISAGNAERLQSLAIAYGQVAAAGRLTGQETLQFVNAGFSPLAEIARTTGRSMAELRIAMEKGQISVQMVADAFKSATEQGGRFYGMADKMAGELTGKVNRLTNEFTKLKEELGSFAEAAGLQSLTTLLRDMTADIKYLRSGQGLGPILSSLFEGTEFGAEMGGTMTPMQRMEFEATGMTPAERKARRNAEIEQLVEQEKAALKRQQETLGRNIIDSFKNATSFFDDASKKYADGVAAASQMVEQGANQAIVSAAEARQGRIRDLIQQREAILGKKDQTDMSAISTDLPKAVSMGTKEAYELVMRTQTNLQAKQLEEQRKQRVAQELTNQILKESSKQNIIGLIN